MIGLLAMEEMENGHLLIMDYVGQKPKVMF